MLQGLSVGGEYGTSATYLSEMATRDLRGFYSSFQYVTLIMGQLLAIAVLLVLQQFVLTNAELEAWGWRIPFVIGAACAVVAFYLRRNLAETDQFKKVSQQEKRSIMRELLQHPREIAIVFGLTMGGTLAFYTYTTYMQKYLVNTVGLSRDQSTWISAGTLFIYMCLQPIIGYLSDKTGRRPILIAFGVFGTILTVPLMHVLAGTKGDPWAAFGLIMVMLVIVSGYTSINAVVKAELFPANVRAIGVGLSYALANTLFGGTAEYVALWFKDQGHEDWFYWYVSGCVFVSLLVYVFMRDTKHHSRIE